MRTLRRMKTDGLVVKVTPEAWGALTVLVGTIAAFVILAIIRH
jgi:hypothetical protein